MQPFINGHLGCFQVLANVNIAAMNMQVLVSFFFCLFAISWAILMAYGGSQARGLIRGVAASLCQSHSNTGSELRL